MRHLLDGRAIDDLAITLLRAFEPDALTMSPLGYWLAHSGGKDSVVISDLADRAGVKHEKVHNLTTVDPPELVRFVKSLGNVQILRPPKSMWQIIAEHHCPPRRTVRFCCQELKERGGAGRFVITGVRAEESNRRSKRAQIETCYRDGTKRYIHPIITWSTTDVWEYIRSRGLQYCSLYDEGFSRIGCILCPMTRNVQEQIARWPRIAHAWHNAIARTFRLGYVGRSGKAFSSVEEYWQWWLDRDAVLERAEPTLFDDDGAALAGKEARE